MEMMSGFSTTAAGGKREADKPKGDDGVRGQRPAILTEYITCFLMDGKAS